MRLWESVQASTESETERERDCEIVGYVLAGRAELHVEGQMVLPVPFALAIAAACSGACATSPSSAVDAVDGDVHSHSHRRRRRRSATTVQATADSARRPMKADGECSPGSATFIP